MIACSADITEEAIGAGDTGSITGWYAIASPCC